MNLTDVISSFTTGTYTVTRIAAGTYGTDGRFSAGSTSTFSIAAVVQPVGGRELQRLPDGMRTQEILSVWSPVELKTQGSGQDPDSVAIDGSNWIVVRVENWNASGAYWKAVVLKTGD